MQGPVVSGDGDECRRDGCGEDIRGNWASVVVFVRVGERERERVRS